MYLPYLGVSSSAINSHFENQKKLQISAFNNIPALQWFSRSLSPIDRSFILIRYSRSAAGWILKHLLLLPICTEEHVEMPGCCRFYASHVQKQLLPDEADIICPVLEPFIRCLTSAKHHLVFSELSCWVIKSAYFKFLEDCYSFLTLSYILQMTLAFNSWLNSRID